MTGPRRAIMEAISGSDCPLTVEEIHARVAGKRVNRVTVYRTIHLLEASGLLRAVDSVCANVAEATGRWHTPDRRRLLYIARGSLAETEHWLRCGERRGLLPGGYSERLSDIRRPLNGLIKKAPPD